MIFNPELTVRLFMEELNKILDRCNNLKITNDELQDLLNDVIYLQLQRIVWKSLTIIISVILICFAVYFICRK